MHDRVSAEKLFDHTWVMTEGTGRGARHCYLLEGKEKAAVIDTGMGDMDVRRLAASCTNRELFAINTHGHLDHIGRDHEFSQVYLHPADEEVFREHSCYEMRSSYLIARFRRKGLDEEQIASAEIQDYIQRLSRLPRRENHVALQDAEKIDLGGRQLEIMHTPGHTGGSVCILDKKYGAVFTGDSLCEQGIPLNFDHSASVETYRDSMRRLWEEAEGLACLFPGHQKIALEPDWIKDYLICTEKILSGKCADDFVDGSAGRHSGKSTLSEKVQKEKERLSCWGRAVIRWRADRLYREG